MFGNIAGIFGYVLNFLYNIVNNYGFAIILFTLLFRILMIPLNYKQQKSAKKQSKVQGEINKLQVKYQNDPAEFNKAMREVYAREKISPMSGCLTAVMQFIIFISIFYLVSQPITYMTKRANEPYYNEEYVQVQQEANKEENSVNVEKTENIEVAENQENVENQENNEENKEENKEVDKNITLMQFYVNKLKEEEPNERQAYQELRVINKYSDQDSRLKINMKWLGFNLTDIPMQNKENWKVFIIPALYVITIFVNTKLINAFGKTKEQKEKEKKAKEEKKLAEKEEKKEETKEEQLEDIQGMTKGLNYMMPIMSVSIALIAPLGLSLYWLTGNIFQLFEKLILEGIFKAQEKGEENV